MRQGIDSNINLYYEGLVERLANRAKEKYDEGEYDRGVCVSSAIDSDFYKTVDKAYVIAYVYCSGDFVWGEDIEWTELLIMLYADVYKATLEKWEDKEGE